MTKKQKTKVSHELLSTIATSEWRNREQPFKHNYAFFDGTYYLTRNSKVLKEGEGIEQLLGLFLQTINKLQRNVQARKIILLFDSGPYKKAANLPNYKADRLKPEVEIEKLRAECSEEGKTPEELEDLQQKIKKLEEQARQRNVSKQVKEILLKNSDRWGLVPFQKPGFEGDDLARFFAKLTSEEAFQKESPLPNVLVSADSDWISFTDTNCELCRVTKKKKVDVVTTYTYEDSKQKIHEFYRDQITPFEYKQISSLYYGNHDNIEPIEIAEDYSSMVKFLEDFTTRKIFNDETFSTYYSALNIEKYYEELKPELEAVLRSGRLYYTEYFEKFKVEYNPVLPEYAVRHLLASLDPSAYNEEFSIFNKNSWTTA